MKHKIKKHILVINDIFEDTAYSMLPNSNICHINNALQSNEHYNVSITNCMRKGIELAGGFMFDYIIFHMMNTSNLSNSICDFLHINKIHKTKLAVYTKEDNQCPSCIQSSDITWMNTNFISEEDFYTVIKKTLCEYKIPNA